MFFPLCFLLSAFICTCPTEEMVSISYLMNQLIYVYTGCGQVCFSISLPWMFFMNLKFLAMSTLDIFNLFQHRSELICSVKCNFLTCHVFWFLIFFNLVIQLVPSFEWYLWNAVFFPKKITFHCYDDCANFWIHWIWNFFLYVNLAFFSASSFSMSFLICFKYSYLLK